MQFKDKIKEFFISKNNPAETIPGNVKNLAQPESICLFFSIRNKEEMDKIDALLKTITPPKKLEAFILNRAEKLQGVVANPAVFCFALNDFNIFGKKNKLVKQKFADSQFDLLISFAEASDIVAQKLIAEVNAAFKIGQHYINESSHFDLVVDFKHKNDFTGYYGQVMHYLSVLNITTK